MISPYANTFKHIELKFSIVDSLPDSLYSEVVTHTHGDLTARATSIMHWRSCMLSGNLPDEEDLTWPEAYIRRTILMRLETLEIVQYCTGQETLTDSILIDVLAGISSAEDFFSKKPGGFVDKLAQRQKINPKDSSFDDPEGLADHVKSSGPRQTPNPANQESEKPSKSNTQERNNSQTGQPVEAMPSPPSALTMRSDEAGAIATAQLQKNWQELAANWHELSSVYSELGGLLGRGWDLSQGLLAAQGWRDIIRYRKLIKDLPELKQLIAECGRVRESVGAEKICQVSERLFNPVKRKVIAEQDTRSDKAVMETGGIELSDDISRLLPSELALLGHPKLKMLWYAKRAESKLLTYRHIGLSPEPTPVEQEIDSEGPKQHDRNTLTHGPIILCLDTSGSMHGAPETIAKVLVLEALRIAYHENRPCYVYAFGGPGQILEHELDLTRGGLRQLLKFLQQSFHGGTDVVQPLLQALAKQKTESWRNADILLVTDGRFPVQTDLFNKIQKLKQQQGLRLHGLLLGNWQSKAMTQLCDPLHCYPDWTEMPELISH